MPNTPFRRLLSAGLIVALLLGTRPSLARQPGHARLLVKLRPQALTTPAHTLSLYPLEHWTPLAVPGWFRGSVPQAQWAAVVAEMARDANVVAVEPDHRVQIAIIPNDTHWAQQWGPEQVRAPAAWDVTTGEHAVVVAILDTGADLDHVDLEGQLWVNAQEVPGNGTDDDGNGYVDDINGWRFGHDAEGNPQGSNAVDDDHGHGTHVTGIIAARGNNGRGTAGMSWGSQAMVVKVLDQKGDGYYSEVANGLVYATDNGAHIANLSLGGPEKSQIMEDAIDYANAHDTLVIAAAGNSGAAVLYPAAYLGVLAVAATDQDDRRASYSCHGSEIDLAAPGSLIFSTCLGDRYCYKSGTSMAAPHVAGLAALLRSQYPQDTAFQIEQRLTSTATDVDSPGWDEYTGWGRIDAARALSATQASQTIYLPIAAIGHDLTPWPWAQSVP